MRLVYLLNMLSSLNKDIIIIIIIIILYWHESEENTKLKLKKCLFFNFQKIGSGGSVKRKIKNFGLIHVINHK